MPSVSDGKSVQSSRSQRASEQQRAHLIHSEQRGDDAETQITGTRGAAGTGGTSPSLEGDAFGSSSTFGAAVGGRTVSAERSTLGPTDGAGTGARSSLCWMWLGSSVGSGGTEVQSVACASGLLAMVATGMLFAPNRPLWTVAEKSFPQAVFLSRGNFARRRKQN